MYISGCHLNKPVFSPYRSTICFVNLSDYMSVVFSCFSIDVQFDVAPVILSGQGDQNDVCRGVEKQNR